MLLYVALHRSAENLVGSGLPHLRRIDQHCHINTHRNSTHQYGKSTAFPLAPNTANERMKRMTWLPPSSAALVR